MTSFETSKMRLFEVKSVKKSEKFKVKLIFFYIFFVFCSVRIK